MLKYLKLDMTHPHYADALEACRQAFQIERHGHEFSINENADGTACWVKTSSAHGLEDSDVVLEEAGLAETLRITEECAAPAWRGDRRPTRGARS